MQEVDLQTGTPVVFEFPRTLGLCFAGGDAARWQGTLSLESETERLDGQGGQKIARASTLCFSALFPRGPGTPGSVKLCARIANPAARVGFSPVCRTIDSRPQALGSYRPLRDELKAADGATYSAALLSNLDALAARARREGFHFLPVYARFSAIEACLRGSDFDEARRRLDALVEFPWIDTLPEAAELAGRAAYFRANLKLDTGSLRDAAEQLSRAVALYETVASPLQIVADMRQAEIVWQVGAVEEAISRVRRAQAACKAQSCDQSAAIANDLAWYILADPDADTAALGEAKGLLETALAQPDPDPTTNANRRINRAFLQVRQRESPADDLAEARRLLVPLVPAGGEHRLEAWAKLVEAQDALGAGRLEEALDRCRELAQRREVSSLLRALAWSCAGEALQRGRHFAEAQAGFERALQSYEFVQPEKLERDIPLGPSQRADTFYRAALLAAERGDPGKALDILARLDSLVLDESCIATLDPEQRRQLRARNREGERRLQALGDHDPAGRERLRDFARQAACRPASGPGEVARATVSAVPLEDGVLLLYRQPDGRIDRQWTAIGRQKLRGIVEAIAGQFQQPTWDAAAWRPPLELLAKALLPPDVEKLGPEVSFALYGLLQGVPLQALPVGPPGSGEVLADRVRVVLEPAARSLPEPPRKLRFNARSRVLFVVDPGGNLTNSRAMAQLYKSRFPEVPYLLGPKATSAALQKGLAGAEIFHFDGHGLYDAVFPELSWLQLAGGDTLSVFTLPDLPIPAGLVNLSGCKTGSWPVTADRGRYGLAGAFARRGTAWVIASRSDLDDTVARDFNDRFYRDLSAGKSVPESYANAIRDLRRERPLVLWAGLFLLRGAGEGGQTAPHRTPR